MRGGQRKRAAAREDLTVFQAAGMRAIVMHATTLGAVAARAGLTVVLALAFVPLARAQLDDAAVLRSATADAALIRSAADQAASRSRLLTEKAGADYQQSAL